MFVYEALKDANNLLNRHIDTLEIVLVAHVLAPRGKSNLLQINCSETEHFTVQEFDEIYGGLTGAGFYIRKVFFSELDFVVDVVSDPKQYSSTIVFNLCRNGTGLNKKALVPAICDLLGILFTSSSAGLCALARNKWLFTSIFNENKIKCPVTKMHIEDLQTTLNQDATVICKPIDGSASQGIDESNIISLKNAINMQNNGVLWQEYIDGYECEVPIFSSNKECFSMPPVGISFEKHSFGILSYDISKIGNYGFYSLSDVLPVEICRKIMRDAEKAFRILNLEKYGRIDFRIDKKTKQHYLIDVSTTPYITHHSSFAFAIKNLNCEYYDIFRLIISAALQY